MCEDEKLQGYLESHDIEWKFNLSSAPWWGGQLERLIGMVKKAMNKVIGGGSLFWNDLTDVLLDVETQVNRRPLNYVEDDPELPILAPATFLFQRTTHLPEELTWRIPDEDLRRRARIPSDLQGSHVEKMATRVSDSPERAPQPSSQDSKPQDKSWRCSNRANRQQEPWQVAASCRSTNVPGA